jgi:hypothetical protein
VTLGELPPFPPPSSSRHGLSRLPNFPRTLASTRSIPRAVSPLDLSNSPPRKPRETSDCPLPRGSSLTPYERLVPRSDFGRVARDDGREFGSDEESVDRGGREREGVALRQRWVGLEWERRTR